jgi:hypothetical protein
MATMQLLATLAMYLDAYNHDHTEPLAHDLAAYRGFLSMVDGLEYLIEIGVDGGLDRETLKRALQWLKRAGIGMTS